MTIERVDIKSRFIEALRPNLMMYTVEQLYEPYKEETMFHLREGVFFHRNPDGSVTLLKRSGATFTDPILDRMEIQADEWVSVITAVAAPSDDLAATHQAARALHLGEKKRIWRRSASAPKSGE